jgi:hypothetical protein
MNLTKYSAAKKALAEAQRVDEVKDIRDKAMAMRAYAMQAKDRVLIDHATEIRLRAERRAGELLRDMEKNKGARGEGRPKIGGNSKRPPKDAPPKLSDLNINKSQSSRWQKLATMSEKDFEEARSPVSSRKHATPLIARSSRKRSQSRSQSNPPRETRPTWWGLVCAKSNRLVRRLIEGAPSRKRSPRSTELVLSWTLTR